MKYKFLLFIVFVEVGIDILMRHSLSWKEGGVFLGIFEVFPNQCGHNWCKNSEFQNTWRSTLKKWPFAFQVYTKKMYEQLSECKEFKNRFICIIQSYIYINKTKKTPKDVKRLLLLKHCCFSNFWAYSCCFWTMGINSFNAALNFK